MAEEKCSSAFALFDHGDELKPWNFPLKPLSSQDIEIQRCASQVLFCGICHSDIHVISGDFGQVQLPLVLGHEMVGIVTQVGSDVKSFGLGDRVGVGPNAGSCAECSSCVSGRQVYCLKGGISTYGAELPDGTITQGGFAQYHRTHSTWAFHIPSNLNFSAAAPLLCAGITTFKPLRKVGVNSRSKVAILGVGGLGHLAIQFAKALGAEVTVISNSSDKAVDAKSFGATEFTLWTDSVVLGQYHNKFDAIVNTVCSDLPWDSLLAMLAPEGTLIQLGAPKNPVNFDAFQIISNGRQIMGSMTGSPGDYEEMLHFCSKFEINPTIELFQMKEINFALDKVRANKIRYRAVLQMEGEQ